MPEFAFRKVLLSGSWDHAHSMLFGPKKYDVEHGFDIITPLRRVNGTTILVNRGFVANSHMNDFFAASRRDSGKTVHVLGMLHAPGPRSKYAPDNRPEDNQWHWLDLDAMKQYAGGDHAHVQAVLVDEIFGNCSKITASLAC
jgi:surfeit locus 1 family protein